MRTLSQKDEEEMTDYPPVIYFVYGRRVYTIEQIDSAWCSAEDGRGDWDRFYKDLNDLQPCGHPLSAIEGTEPSFYCSMCEKEKRTESLHAMACSKNDGCEKCDCGVD